MRVVAPRNVKARHRNSIEVRTSNRLDRVFAFVECSGLVTWTVWRGWHTAADTKCDDIPRAIKYGRARTAEPVQFKLSIGGINNFFESCKHIVEANALRAADILQ